MLRTKNNTMMQCHNSFRLLIWLTILMPTISNAIVIRHDQNPDNYKLKTTPDYLVNMPHEGHAIIISSQWLVTAAHVIFEDYTGTLLNIDGDNYIIDKVVIHPEYKNLIGEPKDLNVTEIWTQLSARADIALVHLDRPIKNKQAISIFRGKEEKSMAVSIIGHGATGDGVRGLIFETKQRKTLRHCQNTVKAATKNWLIYEFNSPPNALTLEGMHGSGDSGGPVTAIVNGKEVLLGLSSWEKGDTKNGIYTPGRYGTDAYATRISYFADWIDSYVNSNMRQ